MPEGEGNNPYTSAANNALWTLQGQIPSTTNSSNPLAPSNPAAIPHNLFATPTIQPSSVINLSNSSDVVIGPMTQYQGPVTIYQYMDATLQSRSTGGIDKSKSSFSTISQKLTTTSKLFILLIVLVLIAVGVITYMELRPKPEPERAPILFGNNYELGTFPNLGNGHLVIDRDQWGASELARNLTIPLPNPVPYVMITHIGVQSKPCTNIYKCSIKMRTYQDSAIAEKKLPDIQSNFYLGDDGNIYVGRGWNWANTYANNTLAVTFMGDYARYIPSAVQLDAAQFLLTYGVTNKHIALDYKLVAHNQTTTTKSPGANVYKEIKKWPRFYPCDRETVRCGSELGMVDDWNAKQ